MKNIIIPERNTPVQIAICDDSRADREKYAKLISKMACKHDIPINIELFESGLEVLFEMEGEKAPVDVLFMDISMPEEDGMAVSRRLRHKDSPIRFSGELVFLTKSEQHAIEAFDVHAFHYIVKGQTPEDKFEEILLNAVEESQEKHKKYLTLRGVGEYRSIDVESIMYFEIRHRIITVHYGAPEETFEFYCQMDRLEEIVLPFGMLRSHKSFIVRIHEIESLTYSNLTLHTKLQLPVGRVYYNNLKTVFDAVAANKGTNKMCDVRRT